MPQSAPTILLIARESLKPGAAEEYDRIESETAVLAAKLGCPHPYLALQPLSGAKNEVWWFNGFDSQVELNSVAEAYKTNEAWNAALTKNQKRKEPLTGKSTEQLADLEPQTHSQPWRGASAICSGRDDSFGASERQQCLQGTRRHALRDRDSEYARRSGAGRAWRVCRA